MRTLRRRGVLAGGFCLAAAPGLALASVRLDGLAEKAAGDAASTTDKVTNIVRWTHDNLEWTGTDYKARSVMDIIKRGGGNCREQALVVIDFLTRRGVDTRMTREINVQPESEQRQQDAAAMIVKMGPRASVFGLRHNDHVWIEYFDEQHGMWLPSDPTINIVGLEAWVAARLGFGKRPVHEIVPYADMLFPIAVFALTCDGKFESRASHYLIDGFAAYAPKAAASPEWEDWKRLIKIADMSALHAYQGKAAFDEGGGLIDNLTRLYKQFEQDLTE